MATFTYDVFLSFRGEDTRRGFTSHLYNALSQKGICSFIDDMELKKGSNVGPAILKAIEQSRVAIVLFSRSYAFSRWCLEELATIVDLYKEKKLRHVFPVFYEVDPSDVRHQRGSYGEAFATHQKRFGDDENMLNRWRMALRCTADLSGFVSSQFSNEYEFIKMIVEQVSSMIRHRPSVPLHVADYPVGLESRVLQVMSLLNVETDDGVRMVGIYGMGGIGKTTIARAVYNLISDQFEGSYFLEDVKENSAKYGLVFLQKMILSALNEDVNTSLKDVNEGILIVRHRLSRKKVLLVLDDVDKIEQLNATVGEHTWFGFGSRVIITARDKHLLKVHGIDSLYRVEELNDKEALDLLARAAFKTDKVDPSYTEVLNRALTYSSGLPLALKVIGLDLSGTSVDQWNDILNEYDPYKKVDHEKLHEVLKLSFDSLEKDEQEIFLDLACFFNGQILADIEYVLCAHHGSSIKYYIEALIEKSLINIDNGRVRLHDLMQDMGREIVRQESLNAPGKRSRLWFTEDVVHVLQENEGSSAIESIFLDFPEGEVKWDGNAFRKMKSLKTLIIRNGCFNKGPTHLPQSLRVLRWKGYPSQSLPYDFHPKKLAILELPDSCLLISGPIQGFMYLSTLDFGYCKQITCIPDVSGLPNLEKLSFEHCENLIEIHDSVGYLDKLRMLDAFCCKKLRTFPPIRMTSLEQFNLSRCSNLEGFPEILGKMENITELHITGSPIKELPFSILNLTRLRKLELQHCGMVRIPSIIVMLPELGSMCVSQCEGLQFHELDKGEKMVSKSSNMEWLILSYCNISNDFLPTGLPLFANVKDLNLSGNNFTVLDACFKECHLLRNLKLDDCRSLTKMRGIPAKLETLSMEGCRALEFLDLTVLPACTEGCHLLKELVLDDCMFLQEIRGLLPNLDHLSAKNCTSLTASCTRMLLDQESIETGNKMFSFPGKIIPEWFAFCTNGESISFSFRNKFPAVSICLVIGPVGEQPITVKFSPQVSINNNEQFLGNQKAYEFKIASDHIFLFDMQSLKVEDNADIGLSDDEWNRVVVSYADHITNHEVPIRLAVKYSGIHTSDTEDVRFTNSPEEMIKTTTNGPQKDLTVLLSSPILTSDLASQLKPLDSPSEDFQEITSDLECHPHEVRTTTNQSDPPIVERCEGDDINLEAEFTRQHESEDCSSNITGSDSDDPFDQVDKRFYGSGDETKDTILSGACSGDASQTSIGEAIGVLELLMMKDLSEVSSNDATLSQFNNLLDLLITSSDQKVTVELKEALFEFRRRAFATFGDFRDTAESVNKLRHFEKQKAIIQKEALEGKDLWKGLKSSMKKASMTIQDENSRKKKLEAEIATLRKQLATKEMDLKQLVLNVENLEAELKSYLRNCDALEEKARALGKEADDLLVANSGVEEEGKAAEEKQNLLNSSWSTDLTSQLSNIKKNILGLSQ